MTVFIHGSFVLYHTNSLFVKSDKQKISRTYFRGRLFDFSSAKHYNKKKILRFTGEGMVLRKLKFKKILREPLKTGTRADFVHDLYQMLGVKPQ